MMRREFTQREKALLLVLVVVLLLSGYVKLFLDPLNAQMSDAQNQLAQAQDLLTVEQTKLARMQKMQTELEDGDISGEVEIPDYDNINNVMIQLDTILTAASDYQMTFAELQFGNELVSRPIQMTFTAGSYSGARAILTALYQCKYCCALSGISVVSSDQNGSGDVKEQEVTVKLTATFYERNHSTVASDAEGS